MWYLLIVNLSITTTLKKYACKPHIHTHTHTLTHTYKCTLTHIHTHTHSLTYALTYKHTHTHIHPYNIHLLFQDYRNEKQKFEKFIKYSYNRQNKCQS